MSHEKKHLAKATILTKTRYIGFARLPVQNGSKDTAVTGLPAPSSNYKLLNGRRWIDMEHKP